jgi:diguanylate cyclase (GGDEF)-like protein
MAVGGLLLLFAWIQSPATRALAWWGGGFLMFAPATALFGLRGIVGETWSIQGAGAMTMLGYGLVWTGARVFEGRKPLPLLAIVGAVLWLAACQSDAFMHSLDVRISLATVIVYIYSFGFIRALWLGRRDGLLSRWPVMALVGLHAAVFPIRAPAIGALPFPLGSASPPADIPALLIFAPLLYSFALVFLLMALTKERAESNQRHAATIDPLTGIPNRRGFSERAERLLARSRQDQGALTLLLFDLDRFKTVNDRFGHRTGDAVLALFSNSAAQSLRPLDLVGRIGGEEFVALLPGVNTETAIEVAERVRSNFAAAASDVNGQPVGATVSVGTASVTQGGYDFDALYGIADAALYRAKQKGRNRIEAGRPAPDPATQHRGLVPVGAIGDLITRA